MLDRSKAIAITIVIILILSAVSLLILSFARHPLAPLGPFDEGPVREGDAWGKVETFSEAPTGTKNSFGDVKFLEYDNNEAVVLGGSVWMLSKATSSNVEMVQFAPPINGSKMNFSFEAYAPRDYNSWKPTGRIPGQFALTTYLTTDTGVRLAGVDLSVGGDGYQHISTYDGLDSRWSLVTRQVLPATTHKLADYGSAPDRYIVSFASNATAVCKITIWHTSLGKIFSGLVATPEGSPALLKFYFNTKIVMVGQDSLYGGWFIDNLACRGASSRYPIVGPVYEDVRKNQPLWLEVSTIGQKPISDATVFISGIKAKYNASNNHYEVTIPREVDWAKPFNYTVMVDGVSISDSVKVTTLPEIQNALLPLWWNGWDWVSVLGEDDSAGPATADSNFAAYDHPYTAYVNALADDSSFILPRQSEIALHYPHPIGVNYGLFWDAAVQAATDGQTFLKDYYDFASRWDDPSYVGEGDTYIGFAYPGNSGTYEYEYALFQAGTKMGGTSSHPAISPGNASIIGSWWIPDGGQINKPPYSWYPNQPIDLLDACRQMRVDDESDVRWSTAMYVAERSGVLSIYNHPINYIPYGSARDLLLRWIDQPKDNYSLENWKATDGEVASYVYGRFTTDVRYNQSSNSSTMLFDISRKDPHSAGYWLVPVTLEIDTQGRVIQEIQITEGNHTYNSSDGSLRNLDSKRIMDVGYDIRDGKLYVSHFWNASAVLKVTYEPPPAAPAFKITESSPPTATIEQVLMVPNVEMVAMTASRH